MKLHPSSFILRTLAFSLLAISHQLSAAVLQTSGSGQVSQGGTYSGVSLTGTTTNAGILQGGTIHATDATSVPWNGVTGVPNVIVGSGTGITITGSNGAGLSIGNGGTLGTAAYTGTSAYDAAGAAAAAQAASVPLTNGTASNLSATGSTAISGTVSIDNYNDLPADQLLFMNFRNDSSQNQGFHWSVSDDGTNIRRTNSLNYIGPPASGLGGFRDPNWIMVTGTDAVERYFLNATTCGFSHDNRAGQWWSLDGVKWNSLPAFSTGTNANYTWDPRWLVDTLTNPTTYRVYWTDGTYLYERHLVSPTLVPTITGTMQWSSDTLVSITGSNSNGGEHFPFIYNGKYALAHATTGHVPLYIATGTDPTHFVDIPGQTSMGSGEGPVIVRYHGKWHGWYESGTSVPLNTYQHVLLSDDLKTPTFIGQVTPLDSGTYCNSHGWVLPMTSKMRRDMSAIMTNPEFNFPADPMLNSWGNTSYQQGTYINAPDAGGSFYAFRARARGVVVASGSVGDLGYVNPNGAGITIARGWIGAVPQGSWNNTWKTMYGGLISQDSYVAGSMAGSAGYYGNRMIGNSPNSVNGMNFFSSLSTFMSGSIAINIPVGAVLTGSSSGVRYTSQFALTTGSFSNKVWGTMISGTGGFTTGEHVIYSGTDTGLTVTNYSFDRPSSVSGTGAIVLPTIFYDAVDSHMHAWNPDPTQSVWFSMDIESF